MASDDPSWIRWSAEDHVEEADRLVSSYQHVTRNPDSLVIAGIHATLAVAKSSKYYHVLGRTVP